MYHDEFYFQPELNSIFQIKELRRFKGGGGAGEPPSSILADTENRKYARETLYPMVAEGLGGRGFGPSNLTTMRSRSLYGGLDTAYAEGKSDFESQMARTLDPKDVRVKDYLSNTLQREYLTRKDAISRGLRTEKVSDIDISMNMASDYLAGEKRMAVSSAQSYNAALQRDFTNQQQAGTFGSNIAAGIGSGMADYYFAQKMGSN